MLARLRVIICINISTCLCKSIEKQLHSLPISLRMISHVLTVWRIYKIHSGHIDAHCFLRGEVPRKMCAWSDKITVAVE